MSSDDTQPIVTKDPLGYALIGPRPVPVTNKPVQDSIEATIHHVSTPDPLEFNVTNDIAEKYTNRMIKDSETNDNSMLGTKEDELPVYSQDDVMFLQKVIPQVRQRHDRMLEFPLPFKTTRPNFPCNRSVALSRTKTTLENMRKRHPTIFKSSIEKFSKNLDLEHPRFTPVPHQHRYNTDGNAYWIPIFLVWQKGKARLVFDAAARTQATCLNDTLLQGPDRNNSLRGVLVRFRRHPYAVTADIENMFYQTEVPEEQRT